MRNRAVTTGCVSYAYGYLSHIAGDVVGHPYVNSVCRNVFRANILLHAASEQFIDQWAWNRAYNANVRVDLFGRMGFDDRPEIPGELLGLLRRTLINTYYDQARPLRLNAEHPFEAPEGAQEMPGFLTEEEIQDAYVVTREFLRLSGGASEMLLEEPYDGADEDVGELRDLIDRFRNPDLRLPLNPDDLIEELMEGIADSDFDDWVAGLEAFLPALAAAFREQAQLGREILAILGEMVAIPDTRLEAILLILYWWRREVYAAYLRLNLLLALTGLCAPEPEWARTDNAIGRRLIVPDGCWGGEDNRFPPLQEPGDPHLNCPEFLFGLEDGEQVAQFERPTTWVGPYARADNSVDRSPDSFIRLTSFHAASLGAYAFAETPQDTRDLHAKRLTIGNAVELTEWMITNADPEATDTDPIQQTVFCDWNLDGDRGYAYKCWEGLVPDPNRLACRLVLRYGGDAFYNVDPGFPERPLSYFPFVWRSVNGDPLNLVHERYISEKAFDEALVATLRVCEDRKLVPEKYKKLDPSVGITEWTSLLPSRLRIQGERAQDNLRFVNGVSTSAYVATLEMRQLLIWFGDNLQAFTRLRPLPSGQLVYNRTDRTLGVIGDFIQAAGDRTKADLLADTWPDATLDPALPIDNVSTLSLIAQLFDGMEQGRPLFLVGYSQGTLIVSSALLAFSRLGQDNEDYVAERVRVRNLAQVASESTAAALTDLLGDSYRHFERPDDALVQFLMQVLPSTDTGVLEMLGDPWFLLSRWPVADQMLNQAPGQWTTLLEGLNRTGDASLEFMDTVFGPHMVQSYLTLLDGEIANDTDGIRSFLFE